MANIHAVHSVGNSIATYLRNAYAAQPGRGELPECDFALMSSGEMAAPIDDATRISLYLYQVTVNEYTRQSRPGTLALSQQAPLGLDPHYLLTAWGAPHRRSNCRWHGRCASSTCIRCSTHLRCHPRQHGGRTR